MKIIHVIYPVIGIMLVLMLCISPVAAFTGDEYIDVVDESGDIPSYTYKNWAYLNEKYIHIYSCGTHWLKSFVTFKPANIPDAPKMYVYTNNKCDIYLPKSVDEWEIEYYSRWRHEPNICIEDLKCSGVINLNEYFGEYIEKGLYLYLSTNQEISSVMRPLRYWAIPAVD